MDKPPSLLIYENILSILKTASDNAEANYKFNVFHGILRATDLLPNSANIFLYLGDFTPDGSYIPGKAYDYKCQFILQLFAISSSQLQSSQLVRGDELANIRMHYLIQQILDALYTNLELGMPKGTMRKRPFITKETIAPYLQNLELIGLESSIKLDCYITYNPPLQDANDMAGMDIRQTNIPQYSTKIDYQTKGVNHGN